MIQISSHYTPLKKNMYKTYDKRLEDYLDEYSLEQILEFNELTELEVLELLIREGLVELEYEPL